MKSGGHVVFHQLLLRAFQNDKKDAGGGGKFASCYWLHRNVRIIPNNLTTRA